MSTSSASLFSAADFSSIIRKSASTGYPRTLNAVSLSSTAAFTALVSISRLKSSIAHYSLLIPHWWHRRLSRFSRFSRFLFLIMEGSLLDYQRQWRNPLVGASFAVPLLNILQSPADKRL
jgi:hypothetical protein